MNSKLQQIHYARAMKRTPDDIIRDLQDAATASIQLRILKALVNQVNKLDSDELDTLLNAIDTTDADWRELVATLNVD